MMIQLMEKLLQRWGVIPPFDKDDILNASIEDKARDTENVIGRLRASLSDRFESNNRLRHSIAIAKERTDSFEQFEQLIAGRNNVHH